MVSVYGKGNNCKNIPMLNKTRKKSTTIIKRAEQIS